MCDSNYNNNEYETAALQPIAQKKKSRTGLKVVALCLVCTLLGGAGGFSGAMLAGNHAPASDGQPSTSIYESNGIETVTVVNLPAGTTMTPEQIYASNVASCVGITVSTTTNVFGYTTTSAATGSGFVLTANGYIVTNYHVIEAAVKDANVPITVSFQNGDSYEAKLIGGESDNDVAVLKIDASDLKPVVLGDSSQLVVGQAVYTIGNPLGELTYSLTDGLVSALDRVITTGSGSDAVSMNMMQTNCAINPGNSGGALFNQYGEVIGITTAKMSSSGSSSSASIEGLGFAIPIDDVKQIVTDLIQHGYVTGKPSMGIQVSSVSQQDAMRYGLQVGAYVEAVNEGSCAEKAGLKVGDIVVAMDDTEVGSGSALVATKAKYRAGDTVTLTVLRGGQKLKLELTFDEEQPVEQETEQTQSQSGQQTTQGNNWGFGNFPFSDFFR